MPKKFNSVFQGYRPSVLHDVVEGRDLMNEESQKMSLELMIFFFRLTLPHWFG